MRLALARPTHHLPPHVILSGVGGREASDNGVEEPALSEAEGTPTPHTPTGIWIGILTRLLNGGGEFPAAYLRIEERRGPSTPRRLRVREASTPLRMTQYKEVEDREDK